MRRGLLPALLCLPLLAVFATTATAQTVPTLKVEIPPVTEGETGTIKLALSHASSQSIEFLVSSVFVICDLGITCPQSTTNAGPSDYSLPSETITLAPGETTKTVSFSTTDDSTSESTEVFLFQISGLATSEATIDSSTPADASNFGNPTWFATILDNDNPANPSITIAPGTSTVTEGTAASFTVTASPAPSAQLTVDLTVSEDTSDGRDFVASGNEGSQSVTIPANQSTATYDVQTVGDNMEEPNGSVTVAVATSTAYTIGSPASASVAVSDDDPTVVTLARTGSSGAVTEGGRITFTVTLGRALVAGETIDVPLYITGAGVIDADFSIVKTSGTGAAVTPGSLNTANPVVRFSGAGAQVATLELLAVDDGAAESGGSETFLVGLDAIAAFGAATLGTNVGGGAVPSMDAAESVFSVQVDDAATSTASTVRFGASDYAVDEGDAVAVEVLLSPAQGDVVTARVSATGIGATGSNVDFDSGPYTVTFAAGETRQTLSISTTQDMKDEGDEGFLLTLTAIGLPAGVTLGSPKKTTVTILDDDQALDAAGPTVVIGTTAPFRTTGPEVTEGDTVTFTLTALRAPASPITVSVLVTESGNFATSGQTGMKTVPIDTNGRGTLTVRTQNDSTAELPGTITATLRPGSGYKVPSLASSASSSVAVADNDSSDDNFIYMSTGAPREQQESVREGRQFGVYRANKSTRNETFGPWGFTICFGGTATRDVDYAVYGQQGRLALDGSGCARISKPGGDRAYFSIDTVDDSHEDSGETIVPTISNPIGTKLYSYGRTSLDFVILNHEVAVADGAEASELSVAVGPASASEGAAGADTYATVTFEVHPVRAQATSFKACLGGSASRGAGGDYRLTGYADAAPLGLTNGCHTATVPAHATTARARLRIRGDAVVEPDETVTVALGGPPPGVTVSASSGTASYTILNDDAAPRNDTAALIAEVDGAIAFQRARANSSHNAIARWTRIRTALTTESVSDALLAEVGAWLEKQRAVNGKYLALGERVWAALNGMAHPDPEVTVSAGGAVTEGGAAAFTVTASPAPKADLTVSLMAGDDATGDFLAAGDEGPRTVVIPAGQGSAALTLATVNDDADEPDGAVTATVAKGTGYRIGSPDTASVAVGDDDATIAVPEVSVSAGGAIAEGGHASFTVTAVPAPTAPLAVALTVGQDGDFAAAGETGARTITIPTSGSVTVEVATRDDGADEPDGAVRVTVDAGAGYTASQTNGMATVAVSDDDIPLPAVSIAARGGSITEGADAAFTVTASRAVGADLAVSLAVSEAAGGDFVAAGNEGAATVTIPRGETEASFAVATVDDAADEPDGRVRVALGAGGGYRVAAAPGDAASVAVSDDDAAPGTPMVSVDDAAAQERERLMRFRVRLSPASEQPVYVFYRVRESTPVSATQYADFTALGSDVVFRPGETEKEVLVYVFDDSHDEDPETFELALTRASGGAVVADGLAVGTIVNSDPMPAAWLSRFGRTVAEQALDGIAGRMSAPRTPGAQGAIAGQSLSFGGGDAANGNATPSGAALDGPAAGGNGPLALADVAQAFGANDASPGPDRFGTPGFGNAHGLGTSRTMTARDLLLGSSFTATGETDGAGGSMAFWGRAAQSRFDGREGTFSLDGEVTTGMLGADYARGKWLVGLALVQSEGEGDYRDSGIDPRPASQICAPVDGQIPERCDGAVRTGDGSVEASLTAAIPYAALQASERLKLWGAAGYGTGEVTLKTAMDESYKSDTAWSMAAAGLRGDLLAPPAEGSGPALAVTSDALWTRTSSEKTNQLAASESDVTRLRLGLEGSYRMALEGGGHLTPKLEVGARHDGGDAETGFGIELGGGIAWNDPALGLSLDVSGRTLIAHGDDDLKDRGYAASLAFDPDPATKRGPSLSLRQEFGGRASGGLDALFAPDPLEERTGSGEATARWAMEAAYGLPAFGGRWTGSPHVGLGLATGARDYTLGWRLTPAANANAPDLSFGLKATRRESVTAEPEHTVGFEVRARW